MIVLKNWSMFLGGNDWIAPELRHPHLQGDVYGNPKFNDGDFVSTSRVVKMEDMGDYIKATTRSGTEYCLFRSDVNPECEKEYPDYYNRVLKSIKKE